MRVFIWATLFALLRVNLHAQSTCSQAEPFRGQICVDDCSSSHDGSCDDASACAFGTDCSDCGSRSLPSPSATLEYVEVNTVAVCKDIDTTTDSEGLGCSSYTEDSTRCSTYDSGDFVAAADCCACGGGETSDTFTEVDSDQTLPCTAVEWSYLGCYWDTRRRGESDGRRRYTICNNILTWRDCMTLAENNSHSYAMLTSCDEDHRRRRRRADSEGRVDELGGCETSATAPASADITDETDCDRYIGKEGRAFADSEEYVAFYEKIVFSGPVSTTVSIGSQSSGGDILCVTPEEAVACSITSGYAANAVTSAGEDIAVFNGEGSYHGQVCALEAGSTGDDDENWYAEWSGSLEVTCCLYTTGTNVWRPLGDLASSCSDSSSTLGHGCSATLYSGVNWWQAGVAVFPHTLTYSLDRMPFTYPVRAIRVRQPGVLTPSRPTFTHVRFTPLSARRRRTTEAALSALSFRVDAADLDTSSASWSHALSNTSATPVISLNSESITVDFGWAVLLDEYTFTTRSADFADDYDPERWKLEGSNGGSVWQTLDNTYESSNYVYATRRRVPAGTQIEWMAFEVSADWVMTSANTKYSSMVDLYVGEVDRDVRDCATQVLSTAGCSEIMITNGYSVCHCVEGTGSTSTSTSTSTSEAATTTSTSSSTSSSSSSPSTTTLSTATSTSSSSSSPSTAASTSSSTSTEALTLVTASLGESVYELVEASHWPSLSALHYLLDRGTCTHIVTDASECRVAADTLKVQYINDVSSVSDTGTYAYGCTFSSGDSTLRQNSDATSAVECASASKCLCRTKPDYEVVVSKLCTFFITSVYQCELAAIALGFSSTGVSYSTRASSSAPPYCFYDPSADQLEFNPGDNTGSCSTTEQCLCLSFGFATRFDPKSIQVDVVAAGVTTTEVSLTASQLQCCDQSLSFANGWLSATSMTLSISSVYDFPDIDCKGEGTADEDICAQHVMKETSSSYSALATGPDTDCCEGLQSSDVDSTASGSYTLTYQCAASGATATRTVNVFEAVGLFSGVLDTSFLVNVNDLSSWVGLSEGACLDNFGNDLRQSSMVIRPVDWYVKYQTQGANTSFTFECAGLTRSVQVYVPIPAVTLTLSGDALVYSKVGTYSDAGASCTEQDGARDISQHVEVAPTIDASTKSGLLAPQTVTYTCGWLTVTRQVATFALGTFVVNGDSTTEVYYQSVYTDAGATCEDDEGNDLTTYAVLYSESGSGHVDTLSLATFQVDYTCVGDTLIRTVTILGADDFSFADSSTILIAKKAGEMYTPTYPVCFDIYDNALAVTPDAAVDLTAESTSSSGETVTFACLQLTLSIAVIVQNASTFTLNDYGPHDLYKGDTWTDPGGACTDHWGNTVIDASSNLPDAQSPPDVDVAGTQTITYTCAEVDIDVTVRVRDATDLSLDETFTMHIAQQTGKTYIPAGASCTDNYGDPVNFAFSPTELDLGTPSTSAVGETITWTCMSLTTTRTAIIQNASTFQLLGDAIVQIPRGDPWVEDGTTCQDLWGNAVNDSYAVANDTINTSEPGSYTLGYTCAETVITREVQVQAAMTLVLDSDATVYLPKSTGELYSPTGSTCTDQFGGTIVHSDPADVDRGIVSSTDAGEEIIFVCLNLTASRYVIIQNASSFVLVGDDPLYILRYDPWSDPGATCTDHWGNSVSDTTLPDALSIVDTTAAGAVTISYECAETTITREVRVKSAVLFELNDPGIQYIVANTSAGADPGAVCQDQWSLNLSIVSDFYAVLGDDPPTPGEYTVSYTCHDAATLQRTVRVPMVSSFTLTSDNPQRIHRPQPYIEFGASCVDQFGNDMTTNALYLAYSIDSSSVDTSVGNAYDVVYTCLNETLTREVRVQIPHVFTLTGIDPVYLAVNEMTFTDPGCVCIDQFGDDVAYVLDTSAIDDTVQGTYFANYSCVDASKQREVEVRPRLVDRGLLEVWLVDLAGSNWTEYHTAQCVLNNQSMVEISSVPDSGSRSEAGNWTAVYDCEGEFRDKLVVVQELMTMEDSFREIASVAGNRTYWRDAASVAWCMGPANPLVPMFLQGPPCNATEDNCIAHNIYAGTKGRYPIALDEESTTAVTYRCISSNNTATYEMTSDGSELRPHCGGGEELECSANDTEAYMERCAVRLCRAMGFYHGVPLLYTGDPCLGGAGSDSFWAFDPVSPREDIVQLSSVDLAGVATQTVACQGAPLQWRKTANMSISCHSACALQGETCVDGAWPGSDAELQAIAAASDPVTACASYAQLSSGPIVQGASGECSWTTSPSYDRCHELPTDSDTAQLCPCSPLVSWRSGEVGSTCDETCAAQIWTAECLEAYWPSSSQEWVVVEAGLGLAGAWRPLSPTCSETIADGKGACPCSHRGYYEDRVRTIQIMSATSLRGDTVLSLLKEGDFGAPSLWQDPLIRCIDPITEEAFDSNDVTWIPSGRTLLLDAYAHPVLNRTSETVGEAFATYDCQSTSLPYRYRYAEVRSALTLMGATTRSELANGSRIVRDAPYAECCPRDSSEDANIILTDGVCDNSQVEISSSLETSHGYVMLGHGISCGNAEVMTVENTSHAECRLKCTMQAACSHYSWQPQWNTTGTCAYWSSCASILESHTYAQARLSEKVHHLSVADRCSVTRRIKVAPECQAVAEALGLTYMGEHTDVSFSSGCFFNNGTGHVEFNWGNGSLHEVSGTSLSRTAICKGLSAPPQPLSWPATYTVHHECYSTWTVNGTGEVPRSGWETVSNELEVTSPAVFTNPTWVRRSFGDSLDLGGLAGAFRHGCPSVAVINPAEVQRKYSTGTSAFYSSLGSSSPWYGTGSSDWMQMDLGQGVNVRGIVVEAAGIHSLRVQYALYDSDAAFNEINEDLVVGDVINTAGNNVEQLPVEVLFPAVVHARYLRLVVGTSVGWSLWSNTAGIRAAAMVCLPTCPDGIIVNPDRSHSRRYLGESFFYASVSGRRRRVLGELHSRSGFCTSGAGEWMTIDLGEVMLVSAIITQGLSEYSSQACADCSLANTVTKLHDTRDDSHVTSYRVRFSEDGSTWYTPNPDTVYTGNVDQSQLVENALASPFLARYVRIVIETWTSSNAGSAACFRAAVRVCARSAGVLPAGGGSVVKECAPGTEVREEDCATKASQVWPRGWGTQSVLTLQTGSSTDDPPAGCSVRASDFAPFYNSDSGAPKASTEYQVVCEVDTCQHDAGVVGYSMSASVWPGPPEGSYSTGYPVSRLQCAAECSSMESCYGFTWRALEEQATRCFLHTSQTDGEATMSYRKCSAHVWAMYSAATSSSTCADACIAEGYSECVDGYWPRTPEAWKEVFEAVGTCSSYALDDTGAAGEDGSGSCEWPQWSTFSDGSIISCASTQSSTTKKLFCPCTSESNPITCGDTPLAGFEFSHHGDFHPDSAVLVEVAGSAGACGTHCLASSGCVGFSYHPGSTTCTGYSWTAKLKAPSVAFARCGVNGRPAARYTRTTGLEQCNGTKSAVITKPECERAAEQLAMTFSNSITAVSDDPTGCMIQSDTYCKDGLVSNDGKTCCASNCTSCGDSSCEEEPHGAQSCCPLEIAASNVVCSDDSSVGCLIPQYSTVVAFNPGGRSPSATDSIICKEEASSMWSASNTTRVAAAVVEGAGINRRLKGLEADSNSRRMTASTSVEEVKWIVGAFGTSCAEACRASGLYCPYSYDVDGSLWPQSTVALSALQSELGVECDITGATADELPAMVWQTEVPECTTAAWTGSSRCHHKANAIQRFCPCAPIWTLATTQESCDATCAASASHCAEEFWPTSIETAEGIQDGSSFWGGSLCSLGWSTVASGDAHPVRSSSTDSCEYSTGAVTTPPERCSIVPNAGYLRLCPCAADVAWTASEHYSNCDEACRFTACQEGYWATTAKIFYHFLGHYDDAEPPQGSTEDFGPAIGADGTIYESSGSGNCSSLSGDSSRICPCVRPQDVRSPTSIADVTLSVSPAAVSAEEEPTRSPSLSLDEAGTAVATYSLRVSSGEVVTVPRIIEVVEAELQLFGERLTVLSSSQPVAELPLGARCIDADLVEEAVSESSRSSTGNYTEVEYACATTSASELRGYAVVEDFAPVLRGSSEVLLEIGEAWIDPGACCVQHDAEVSMKDSLVLAIHRTGFWMESPALGAGTSSDVSGRQSVYNEVLLPYYGSSLSASFGEHGLLYSCSLLNEVKAVQRQVAVNMPPEIERLGDALVFVSLNSQFVDEGVVCRDAEDGFILASDLGSLRELKVRRGGLSPIEADVLCSGSECDAVSRDQWSSNAISVVTCSSNNADCSNMLDSSISTYWESTASDGFPITVDFILAGYMYIGGMRLKPRQLAQTLFQSFTLSYLVDGRIWIDALAGDTLDIAGDEWQVYTFVPQASSSWRLTLTASWDKSATPTCAISALEFLVPTFATVAPVFDGRTPEATSLYDDACPTCMEITSTGYVWLDLGYSHVVHTVAINFAEAGSIDVKVGNFFAGEVSAGDGWQDCATVTTSSANFSCTTPTEGRFLLLETTATNLLCEVQAFGTPGTAAPSELTATWAPSSQCSDMPGSFAIVGVHAIDDEATTMQIMYEAESTGYVIKREAWPGQQANRDVWVLRDSSDLPIAMAPAGTSTPPPEGWITLQTSGSGCTSLILTAAGVIEGAEDNPTGTSVTSRLELAGQVNESSRGIAHLVYTCRDSAGASTAVSREVEVGCESPNPTGPAGGNWLSQACLKQLDNTTLANGSARECSRWCLDVGDCHGYEFFPITESCVLLGECSGRYFTDTTTVREVAYCRRVNSAPNLTLSDGDAIVNQNDVWIPPDASCSDLQDAPAYLTITTDIGYPPILNTSTSGTKTVTFTCTDTADPPLTDTKAFEVVVVGECTSYPSSETRCVGGDIVANLEVCTLNCTAPNYAPEPTTTTCLVPAGAADPSVPEFDADPVCSPNPCDDPQFDVDTINQQEDGRPQSCVGIAAGSVTRDGETCTPNCDTADYVLMPTDLVLTCKASIWYYDVDNLLSLPFPDEYGCILKARPPASMTNNVPGTTEVTLIWTAGAEVEYCSFLDWQIMAQLQDVQGGESDGWTSVSGCEDLNVRAVAECTAVNLLEGRKYYFRVQERCLNSLYDSDLTYIYEAVQLQAVDRPEMLLGTPSGTIFSDPGQVMLALTSPCLISSLGVAGSLMRYDCGRADVYPDIRFDFVPTELISNRILMVSANSTTFYQAGCKYYAYFGANMVKTVELPTKYNLVIAWNFTFEEPVPALLEMKLDQDDPDAACGSESQDGLDCAMYLEYDSDVDVNCTATPYDSTLQELYTRREHRIGKIIQFSFTDLYPSSRYYVSCAGQSKDSYWLKLAEHVPLNITTKDHTNTELSSITVSREGECKSNGWTQLRTPKVISPQLFGSGDLILLNNYELICSETISPGDNIKVRSDLSVILYSNLATVTWYAPTEMGVVRTDETIDNTRLEYNITKPLNDDPILEEHQGRFQVCSHAYENARDCAPDCLAEDYCQDYVFTVTCVDVSLEIVAASAADTDGNCPSVESCSCGNTSSATVSGTNVTVKNGDWVALQMMASMADFDWNTVTFYLGSLTEGFQQEACVSGDTVRLKSIQGQGRSLPLVLLWREVEFVTTWYFSFTPPEWVVAPLSDDDSLLSQGADSQVFVTFTGNMPKISSVSGTTAEFWLRLSVKKEDLEPSLGRAGGLCEDTAFAANKGNGWTLARCYMIPAPLENITVRVEVKDYLTGAYVLPANSLAEAGVIQFQVPSLSQVQAIGESGGNAAVVQLSVILDRTAEDDEVRIYVQGQNFPDPSQVSVEYGMVEGFSLRLVPAGGSLNEEVELCDSILYMSENQLLCTIAACLDVDYLPEKPSLKLRVGDLSSPELVGAIQMPLPSITSFSPNDAVDVGKQTFTVKGKFFGLPCQSEDGSAISCTDACTYWTGKGQGVTRVYGATRIMMGLVECEVKEVDDTSVLCETPGTSIAPTRSDPEPGEAEGSLIYTQTVDATLQVGSGDEPLQATDRVLVKVNLATCEIAEGYQRITENRAECEPCPAGRYMNENTDQYPVRCDTCAAGKYTDADGATTCASCPSFTTSVAPRNSIESCICLEGYFSPYVDSNGLRGLPGYVCQRCNTEDMLATPEPDERCGYEVPKSDLCIAPVTSSCAPLTATSSEYRLCMVSCAGGTSLPRAKPTFYITGIAPNLDVANATAEALGLAQEHAVYAVRCEPLDSCLSNNECDRGYESIACGNCAFGFYRDSLTNECLECGAAQRMGIMIMAVVSVCMSVGAFFVAIAYMRYKADPRFRERVDEQIEDKVKSKAAMLEGFMPTWVSEPASATVRIRITATDLHGSWLWHRHGDLGMVFRCDPLTRQCWIAGVKGGSVAEAKGIKGNWCLMVVNGSSLRADTEAQVRDRLKRCKPPLTLVFWAKRRDLADEELANVEELASGVGRIITMSLGAVQSFNFISRLDMNWPPIFQQLSALVAQLAFSFNFFAPECSVEAPYHETWLTMTFVPYFILFPLFVSYCLLNVFLRYSAGKDHQLREVLLWMLMNAWARTMCICLMLFFNNHIEQLFQPFTCLKRDDGTIVMKASQETPCSLDDPNYQTMFMAGSFGAFAVAGLVSTMLWCIWKSWRWQRECIIRDRMPFYAAVVEVSVADMRGYEPNCREYVFRNMVSTRVYGVDYEQLNMYVQVRSAKEKLGGPRGQKKTEEEEVEDAAHDLMERVRIEKGKEVFFESKGMKEGTVITYGWILVMNNFGRQFCLLTSVMFSADFPPFGAASQALIFLMNFMLLIIFRPYNANLLNLQESLLMGCMGLLTWLAAFKELLSEHNQAYLYPTTINLTSSLIEGLCILIGMLVLAVLGYNVGFVAKKSFFKEDRTTLLNRVHFERHQELEQRKADKEEYERRKCVERMQEQMQKEKVRALMENVDVDEDDPEGRELIQWVLQQNLQRDVQTVETEGGWDNINVAVQQKRQEAKERKEEAKAVAKEAKRDEKLREEEKLRAASEERIDNAAPSQPDHNAAPSQPDHNNPIDPEAGLNFVDPSSSNSTACKGADPTSSTGISAEKKNKREGDGRLKRKRNKARPVEGGTGLDIMPAAEPAGDTMPDLQDVLQTPKVWQRPSSRPDLASSHSRLEELDTSRNLAGHSAGMTVGTAKKSPTVEDCGALVAATDPVVS